jgi:hypothetical protein
MRRSAWVFLLPLPEAMPGDMAAHAATTDGIMMILP